MASNREFVEYVAGQMAGAGDISYRAMFGEYAVYCDGKVIGLICENRLYIKPTNTGRAHIGHVKEAPAYPGAKPSFLVDHRLENKKWLSTLVQLTSKELPDPKPKRRSRSKAKRK